MTLLQCDGVSFGYAGDTLFQDVTFRIGAGERFGLVAPNGAGKTTLLKILTGDLTPDEGHVSTPTGLRIGYLKQTQSFAPDASVLDALLSSYSEIVRLRDEIAHLSEAAASGDEKVLNALADAQTRYEHADGHAIEHRVEALAFRVGFTRADLARAVRSLSGGERGRLSLGVVLAGDPRLLFLDEPTNHLDLDTTETLEEWLRAFHGGVIIVSHDRAFLDATCNRIGELGSKRLRLYTGNYSTYLVTREGEMERENAAVERQREEIARTEAYIQKNLAGTRTTQAQSRRRALEKLERLERPEDVWKDASKIALRFAPARRAGDIVLECTALGAKRGDKALFSGVDLLLRRGDRLGIIGSNGTGKSTLLKMLAGLGEPGDAGSIKRGTNLDEGYFDQHLESLDPTATPIEEIRRLRPELVVDAVRTYLGRFRISGDDSFRPVSSFSGGERTRLALAKLLLVSRNLLFLDEPTNHLDIPASEILEDALANFEGSVVVVSHDRYFLDRVCTRILRIDGGRAQLYPGAYSEYRQAAERERAIRAGASIKPTPPKATPEPAKPAQAQDARVSHEVHRAAKREAERKQRRKDALEKEIATLETEQKALKESLVAADTSDWEKLSSMAERERDIAARLDRLMEEWAGLEG